MSIRLQSWFPFTVHIYLNGREWLARQMDRAGIGYRRHDNCFTWVEQVREELTALIECRRRWKGQSVRALHPFDPQDHALLQIIFRGEFQINGLRNRDLQPLLYSAPPKTPAEQRKRSAAISRKLRLLRAHGLIRKRSRSHRYDVTRTGRLILNAILLAHRITVRQITAIAA